MPEPAIAEENKMKLCECGCGAPAPIAKKTRTKQRSVKGQPTRFLRGHNIKESNNPNWIGGRILNNHGYIIVRAMGHPRADSRGYVFEHVLIAGSVLGKPLSRKVEVHHVNGNRSDNRNQNLVICQDSNYHRLLHRRARAFQRRTS